MLFIHQTRGFLTGHIPTNLAISALSFMYWICDANPSELMIITRISLDFGRHCPSFCSPLTEPLTASVLPSFSSFCPSPFPKPKLLFLPFSSNEELMWTISSMSMAEAKPANPDGLPSLAKLVACKRQKQRSHKTLVLVLHSPLAFFLCNFLLHFICSYLFYFFGDTFTISLASNEEVNR